MDAGPELERGRKAYLHSDWEAAHRALTRADELSSLGADDLESLATACYMLGREAEYMRLLERTHGLRVEEGDTGGAALSAIWLGINFARSGEMGPASGWLGRAQRLLEADGTERAERGYLLISKAFAQEASGDWQAAAATLSEAAGIGEQSGDRDLFALAAHEQGHVLIRHDPGSDGLSLLDEAMVAVLADELSPIVSGIVYCGVILACQDAHEVRRAAEWTEALTRWCERQPDLVAFTGRCLVHRSEIMELRGAWADALGEAEQAAERSARSGNRAAVGEANYRQGELHRLRGELDEAEEAYRAASRASREPQPGLALLRLAQRRSDAAETAIRRLLAEPADVVRRRRLLPAAAEVLLSVGDVDAAHAVVNELHDLAESGEGEWLRAHAGAMRGAVELERGEPKAALAPLREAAERWRALEAPYELARVRARIAATCRALGDEDSATMELEGAQATFTELGAVTDLERLASLAGQGPAQSHGLTPRELEVLQRVAAGETNKAIAGELVLSVRTVDRHVSNIFAKLGVSSRAAAATFAHEHDLV